MYAELRKALAVHAPEWPIWSYRDQQGREAGSALAHCACGVDFACAVTALQGRGGHRPLLEVVDSEGSRLERRMVREFRGPIHSVPRLANEPADPKGPRCADHQLRQPHEHDPIDRG